MAQIPASSAFAVSGSATRQAALHGQGPLAMPARSEQAIGRGSGNIRMGLRNWSHRGFSGTRFATRNPAHRGGFSFFRSFQSSFLIAVPNMPAKLGRERNSPQAGIEDARSGLR